MKDKLHSCIEASLVELRKLGVLEGDEVYDFRIEVPKKAEHGDYSTNLALLLAKSMGSSPRKIAEQAATLLEKNELFDSVSIAGPGFINFTLADEAIFAVIESVKEQGESFGRNSLGNKKSVQIEFVSANPTGPLHVGHGRGAAIGSALASLYQACGYIVHKEYYVNDAGRQMDILAVSVYLRWLQEEGCTLVFPSNGYQGVYISEIARDFNRSSPWLEVSQQSGLGGLITDVDTDAAMDELIACVKAHLGTSSYELVRSYATKAILEGIKDDLRVFEVTFDSWFSELSLHAEGIIEASLNHLDSKEYLYVSDGATWFRSTLSGDEKDRVVIRDNGQKTYFAADIAYHAGKFDRGFEKLVDVWGADHHGYIPRVKAALEAMGKSSADLDVVLVQFAVLMRDGAAVAMSTRSGNFVTLRDLVDEVGVDAARFFYLMRRSDQHMEFDLSLAVSKTNENPVYYVQYAHARICSIMTQASSLGEWAWTEEGPKHLSTAAERKIAIMLAGYPEVLISAVKSNEPHLLPQYLRQLAQEFHAYYNSNKVLSEDKAVRFARLSLVDAVRQVLANGLGLLNISAPRSM